MHEIAIGTRIECQRLIVFGDRPPAQRIAPHKSERIAEHQTQRRRGLNRIDCACDDWMIGTRPTIMGGDRGISPVAPT
ncbi:hypothetical protein, partial [Mesorhizobium sp.]|uniref:hypothetical protein n=1 Tax=Mesorhizobium sp. TaxID=1871066 RepID=UPI0025EFFA27